jgi:histidinol-phosphate aminotransferase
VSSLPTYQWQPTTAEIAAAAGIPEDQVERFDHNTSPLPTLWAADVVGKASAALNEYPGASYRPLREAVATAVGTEPERVAVGAGADELILLAARAFLSSSTAAVAATPTYTLYRIATAQVGARFVGVGAAPPDFAFPADEVIDAARDAHLTWMCIPANPVGNRPAPDEIDAVIAATDGVVVIDAAYAEFAGDSWVAAADRHHNLLVLHTMSKAYGIGGARVGYGLGHPDLIGAIDAVRPPGSLSTLSVELAIAALAAPDRMRDTVTSLTQSRVELAPRLAALGFRVLPSEANFLLCDVGPDARALQERLMAEGLVVRRFPADGPLANYLRFTIRSPHAHDRLIDALERSL